MPIARCLPSSPGSRTALATLYPIILFGIGGCDAVFFKVQDVELQITDSATGTSVAGASVTVVELPRDADSCEDNESEMELHDYGDEGTADTQGRAVIAVHSVTIWGGLLLIFGDELRDEVAGQTFCVAVAADDQNEILEVTFTAGEQTTGESFSVEVVSTGTPVLTEL